MINKEFNISGLATIQVVTDIKPLTKNRELIYLGNDIAEGFSDDYYRGEKVILVKSGTKLPDIDIFYEFNRKDLTVRSKNIELGTNISCAIFPLSIFEHVYFGYKLIETTQAGKELIYLWKHHQNGLREEIVIKEGLDVGKILCVTKKFTKPTKKEKINETNS